MICSATLWSWQSSGSSVRDNLQIWKGVLSLEIPGAAPRGEVAGPCAAEDKRTLRAGHGLQHVQVMHRQATPSNASACTRSRLILRWTSSRLQRFQPDLRGGLCWDMKEQ